MSDKKQPKIDLKKVEAEDLDLAARRAKLRTSVHSGSKSLGRALGSVGRAIGGTLPA
jgi:hypothetical protein